MLFFFFSGIKLRSKNYTTICFQLQSIEIVTKGGGGGNQQQKINASDWQSFLNAFTHKIVRQGTNFNLNLKVKKNLWNTLKHIETLKRVQGREEKIIRGPEAKANNELLQELVF